MFALVILLAQVLIGSPSLKITGSSTVNPVVAEAAEVFRSKGWKIIVDTQGGSSGGIAFLGEGRCDIAMSSRPISERDRKKYPKVAFYPATIGYDGVALVVSTDLYQNGVRSLSQAQVKDLYQGQVKNWQKLGGPARPVVFFNKEPGRGTWEVFAKFVYGKANLAPKVFHPEVGSNQEARTKVANHPGAITQLSASWAWESAKVKAIALKIDRHPPVLPTKQSIASGRYPMRRPLLLITRGQPTGPAQAFIDYLKTAAGQRIVAKQGYLPNDQIVRTL